MTYQTGDWIPLSSHKDLPRLGGVYVIRNTVDSKEYVGKSNNIYRRVDMHVRVLDPRKLLYRSMRKNGIDCFECCVIHLSVSDQELCDLEVLTIATRKTFHPAGYNQTLGGDGLSGHKPSAETLEKMRNSLLGSVLSTETRAKISLAHTGLKHTEAHKLKISIGNTGRVHTETTKQKMRIWNIGRKHTEATLLKMSAFQLSRGSLSEATKTKLSKILLGNNRRAREVLVWGPNDMLPKLFTSAKEAGKYLGVSVGSVSNWCLGKVVPSIPVAVAYV